MHVYMYISVFESYYDVMYIICRGEWSCCKAGISGPCINRQWHCCVDEGDVLVGLIGLFLGGGGEILVIVELLSLFFVCTWFFGH